MAGIASKPAPTVAAETSANDFFEIFLKTLTPNNPVGSRENPNTRCPRPTNPNFRTITNHRSAARSGAPLFCGHVQK
ncbi:hypothetical protein [Altererythrobacter xiamenensis]|uniref:hypothetical protein n=1 Tax=Altererythrobacter xiamenensis TaxID=1316679 RepID=UPI0011782603|nr:hypothetical protein [Altererythrobacter xiamenensis]